MMSWDDDCTFLNERLELFLDGELSGSENLRFLTHLKECEHCAASWADDEAVSEAILVAVAPDVAAETPAADVAAAPSVVQDASSSRPSRAGWWRFAATALAASLVTAFLAVGFLGANEDAPGVPSLARVSVVSLITRLPGSRQR